MPFSKETFNELCLYLRSHELELPISGSDWDMGKFFLDTKNRKHFWQWIDSKDATVKSYIYMVTFTLKPSFEDFEKAENYIKDQVNRDSLGIVNMWYVKELTKAGRPHWHACLITSKTLKRNRFQYYEKLFGHVDVSRTKGQTPQEALNYMAKDGQPIQLK